MSCPKSRVASRQRQEKMERKIMKKCRRSCHPCAIFRDHGQSGLCSERLEEPQHDHHGVEAEAHSEQPLLGTHFLQGCKELLHLLNVSGS